MCAVVINKESEISNVAHVSKPNIMSTSEPNTQKIHVLPLNKPKNTTPALTAPLFPIPNNPEARK
jgi:hypothetical protein